MLCLRTFYLDTAIWLDAYERRGIRGKHAIAFFKNTLTDNFLVSDFLIQEFKELGYSKQEIVDILSVVPHNRRIIAGVKGDTITRSRGISRKRNVRKKDAIHAMIAKNNEAVLITRDQHFQQLKDITGPFLPEAFI